MDKWILDTVAIINAWYETSNNELFLRMSLSLSRMEYRRKYTDLQDTTWHLLLVMVWAKTVDATGTKKPLLAQSKSLA